jgi:hypothetical protein
VPSKSTNIQRKLAVMLRENAGIFVENQENSLKPTKARLESTRK